MRVIAIDGPAGTGKSTIARAVAERLGLDHLDTGAMYRAVTFAALANGVPVTDNEALAALARRVDLMIEDGTVTVDGVDATAAIRGPEVTAAVSTVAANAAVRAELVARQREWANRHRGGVLEGRDIGTAVFPDAELKVYLTASPAVRARRRGADPSGAGVGEGAVVDLAAVEADLARRDLADSSRAASPLAQAADAVVVDTSDLTVAQVVDRVLAALAAAAQRQLSDS